MKFIGQILATVATSAAIVIGLQLGSDLYSKYKNNKSK